VFHLKRVDDVVIFDAAEEEVEIVDELLANFALFSVRLELRSARNAANG